MLCKSQIEVESKVGMIHCCNWVGANFGSSDCIQKWDIKLYITSLGGLLQCLEGHFCQHFEVQSALR